MSHATRGSVGPSGYNEIQNWLRGFPLGGLALLMLVRWIRRIPRRWHPSTVCTHNLVPLHSLSTPRCCRPCRAASTVSGLWVRRRFMTSCVASESTPMSRPPGLTRNWSVAPVNTPTYPAGQPAGEGQRAVAVWGPRAGRSLVAPVRQAPAHAAGSSPALPGSSRHCAARGKVAGEHGAHRRQGGGPGPDQRSEPRSARPADAPFPWFEVDHDGGDSSST
jgi:hypothetical protein